MKWTNAHTTPRPNSQKSYLYIKDEKMQTLSLKCIGIHILKMWKWSLKRIFFSFFWESSNSSQFQPNLRFPKSKFSLPFPLVVGTEKLYFFLWLVCSCDFIKYLLQFVIYSWIFSSMNATTTVNKISLIWLNYATQEN